MESDNGQQAICAVVLLKTRVSLARARSGATAPCAADCAHARKRIDQAWPVLPTTVHSTRLQRAGQIDQWLVQRGGARC